MVMVLSNAQLNLKQFGIGSDSSAEAGAASGPKKRL